jgi:hypothetical protein
VFIAADFTSTEKILQTLKGKLSFFRQKLKLFGTKA